MYIEPFGNLMGEEFILLHEADNDLSIMIHCPYIHAAMTAENIHTFLFKFLPKLRQKITHLKLGA